MNSFTARFLGTVLVLSLLSVGSPGQAGAQRYRFDGTGTGQFQGVSVSDAGDVDLDGFADVVVGASGNQANGNYSGAIRVYSGRTGLLIGSHFGSQPFDELGYSVSAAGDVNLDGYADIVAGAIGDSANGTSSGAARIFSGEYLAKTFLGQSPVTPPVLFNINGDSPGDNLGLIVSDCGDINQDGRPDIIVGAPRSDVNAMNAGCVKVISGASGVVLAAFYGDAAGDQLGHACSGAGDVNNDGWADVLGGAFLSDVNGTNSGMMRVYSGEWIAKTSLAQTPLTPQILGTIAGENPGDRFGLWVGRLQDVNGDAYGDLVAGAPSADWNGLESGSAYVISGEWVAKTLLGQTPSTPRFLFRFDGEAPFDNFGLNVTSAGDVDGDGINDIIGGSPLNDHNGSNAGSVRIYSGATGQVLEVAYGTTPGAQFGIHVSTAGDVNLDGFHDIVVGAPFDAPNGTNSGSSFVRSVAAANVYGTLAAPGNTLSLQWLSGPAPQKHAGTIHISNADPLALGLVAISSASANIIAGSIAILIDIGPAYLDFFPIPFSAQGDFQFPLDMKQPLLGGVSFYVQAAATSPNLAASNGLLLHFSP